NNYQKNANLPLVAFENLSEPSGSHGAGNNGHECSELYNAVAPGEPFLWQKLRQQSIFRRTEQCSLCGHKKEHNQRKWEVRKEQLRMAPEVGYLAQIFLLSSRQSKNGHTHRCDLNHLSGNRDLTFAEAVCQNPTGHPE